MKPKGFSCVPVLSSLRGNGTRRLVQSDTHFTQLHQTNVAGMDDMAEDHNHLSTSPAQVLVVDDEVNQRTALARMIENWGFRADTAADGVEAHRKIQERNFNVVVTDLLMPGMDGMQLLRRLQQSSTTFPSTIVLTGYGSLDTAITTVHEYGAFWMIEKPIRPRTFRHLLRRAAARSVLAKSQPGAAECQAYGTLGRLVGSSAVMQEVFSLIKRAAGARANVLITGESGTGKELVARAIHDLSPRRNAPFIALNCAATPESLIESELFGHEKGAFTGAWNARAGSIESARGGTLLLDEIGEMPPHFQAKLLRVIEDRKVRRLGSSREIDVDVRIIASTNRDLAGMAKKGTFREDLLFRLNVLHISLPPLRDRLDDLPAICRAIASDLKTRQNLPIAGIEPEAIVSLRKHTWPGNVRELRNVLERAAILAGGELITASHLPKGLGESALEQPQRILATPSSVILPFGTSLKQAERELIEVTLIETKHNLTKAAKVLGVTSRTLYNKLRDRIIQR